MTGVKDEPATKGIILAGGMGTRLRPLTLVTSKQLLPIYDKPMIYFPLSVLMLAGIRETLIITTPGDQAAFKRLLGDGSQWGLRLEYVVQQSPRGLADAFLLGESFLGNSPSALVLGDNIFYGEGLSRHLHAARSRQGAGAHSGATIFAYRVKNPSDYGIIEFGDDNETVPRSIEEKPKVARSDWAVTGLYFYDNQVVNIAKSIKPSARGELEITDVNRAYLDAKNLTVVQLGRGFAWLDTGTHEALLEAGEFVRAVEHRQGLKIACLEEIALANRWISPAQVMDIARSMGDTEYARYLKSLVLASQKR
jgi:glucose-1-phosphate thymidylyltransferase